MKEILTLSLSFMAFCAGFFEAFDSIDNGKAEEGRKGRIIRVSTREGLQEALNNARGGDVIELAIGVNYDPVVLPKKESSDFITIRPVGGERFGKDLDCNSHSKRRELMAKIVTQGKGLPAVSTESGAKNYRFVCIEFAHEGEGYVYNLVYLGVSDGKGLLPQGFEFDRCVFRSSESGQTRRGLAVNAADVVVTRSYFEGFAYPQEETQAIAGWTGTKNIKIIENYIEGGAENILFGGADPESPDLIPQNIEVRGNVFRKLFKWKGKATLKCLFELKNAKRVIFVENYLKDNWEGAAFRITVRNQDGKAPFSTIEDIVIENNIIQGAGDGINILGRDDTFPSQTLKNLVIRNNLFLEIGTSKFIGSGYFVQISGGENILIENNTVFNEGNIITFHSEMPRRFVFRNNVVGHGLYGVHGHPSLSLLAKDFQNNAIINNRKIKELDKSFPEGNFWFSNYANVIGNKSESFKPLRRIGFDPSKLPQKLLDKILKPYD